MWDHSFLRIPAAHRVATPQCMALFHRRVRGRLQRQRAGRGWWSQ